MRVFVIATDLPEKVFLSKKIHSCHIRIRRID